MLFPGDKRVNIQREWKGWRTAFVRLCDLDDVHWLQPEGAPKPLIHAYVACTSIVEGELAHDCNRTLAPHRLLVCVLKCHSTASLYAELVRRADEQSVAATGVQLEERLTQRANPRADWLM